MKIYTGGGDRGKTSLFSGERVSKDHIRIEAYGDVDELNSVLGAMAASIDNAPEKILEEVERIQGELFIIGAWLATTAQSPSTAMLENLSGQASKSLEKSMDRMDEQLPRLKGFILPGGTAASGWAHVARAVCRRAERHVIACLSDLDSEAREKLLPMLIYLNRLSDYLFVLARHLNRLAGLGDSLWKNE